jgi:hypothetical protein
MLLLLVRTQKDTLPEHEPPHPWDDIREGVRYLNAKPVVRNAIIQLVLLFSVFAALAVLAVRLAEVMPALKASQFGFLLAAAGVGMAIGAALIGQFGARLRQRSLLGLRRICRHGEHPDAGMAWTTQQLWPTLGLIAHLGLFCGADWHPHADNHSRTNAHRRCAVKSLGYKITWSTSP